MQIQDSDAIKLSLSGHWGRWFVRIGRVGTGIKGDGISEGGVCRTGWWIPEAWWRSDWINGEGNRGAPSLDIGYGENLLWVLCIEGNGWANPWFSSEGGSGARSCGCIPVAAATCAVCKRIPAIAGSV